MQNIFYDSYSRFTNRIKKRWDKNGFKYNSSHVVILFYAWQTKVLFANLQGLKRSKINIVDTQQIKLKI